MKPATPVSQRAELLLLGTGLVLVLYIAANFVYLSVLPWATAGSTAECNKGSREFLLCLPLEATSPWQGRATRLICAAVDVRSLLEEVSPCAPV